MPKLTSLFVAASMAVSGAAAVLPTEAGAVPIVQPGAMVGSPLPVEQTAYYGYGYGRRLCFYRFGWHGPGLYPCRWHRRWWYGGYGYGYGGYGYGWRHRYWHRRYYGGFRHPYYGGFHRGFGFAHRGGFGHFGGHRGFGGGHFGGRHFGGGGHFGGGHFGGGHFGGGGHRR